MEKIQENFWTSWQENQKYPQSWQEKQEMHQCNTKILYIVQAIILENSKQPLLLRVLLSETQRGPDQ